LAWSAIATFYGSWVELSSSIVATLAPLFDAFIGPTILEQYFDYTIKNLLKIANFFSLFEAVSRDSNSRRVALAVFANRLPGSVSGKVALRPPHH
jgi:hypothetical protein